MHPTVNIALRAARGAAEMFIHASDRPDRINVIEREGNRVVTSLDGDAEKTILYHLQKAYPDYSVQSRLSGYSEGKDKLNTWLIDPLSNSANFARGYNQFSVSVALQTGKRISHAVLINPIQGEEFTASRGNGAQLNTSRLRVAKRDSLDHGFVGIEASDSEKFRNIAVNLQQRLLPNEANIRQIGCPALAIAYAAAGKLDAGWVCDADPTTLAAALLILQESGALISDEHGNPETANSQELIFGSPKCFKQLLQLRKSIK